MFKGCSEVFYVEHFFNKRISLPSMTLLDFNMLLVSLLLLLCVIFDIVSCLQMILLAQSIPIMNYFVYTLIAAYLQVPSNIPSFIAPSNKFSCPSKKV